MADLKSLERVGSGAWRISQSFQALPEVQSSRGKGSGKGHSIYSQQLSQNTSVGGKHNLELYTKHTKNNVV